MYKTISVLVALAMVAAVAPGMQADETSYADRNIEWLLETYPELENFAPETLQEIGERSDRADLGALMAGADHPSGTNYVGDVWILGTVNACPADNVIAPGHGQFVPVDTQLFLYPDPVQDLSATGALSVIGWTDKQLGFHASVHTLGTSDNFCFIDPFTGLGFYFPYINGAVSGN